MTEDNTTTPQPVDAQGNPIPTPNAPSASSLSAGATDATASAPNSANANSVGELSTSGLAGALAGADDRLAAVSTAGVSDPNANVAASTQGSSATLSGSVANANVAAAKADADFINDPATQQPSLAGTSGKQGNDTGMAFDVGVEKLTPAAAAQSGSNLGVDAANVNVKAVGAPNPILHEVQKRTAELKLMVSNQEKTPWIQRALKDLQTFEEWVIQHFEEAKRKL